MLVAFIVILPQGWAYLRTPVGTYFVGVNMFANLVDVEGVYFPAIRNFANGDILSDYIDEKGARFAATTNFYFSPMTVSFL